MADKRPSRSKAAVEGRALADRHIALRTQMRQMADELGGPTIYQRLVAEQRFNPRMTSVAPLSPFAERRRR